MTHITPARRRRLAILGFAIPVVVLIAWLSYHGYERRPARRYARALAALQAQQPDLARQELDGWPNSPEDQPRHLIAGWLLVLNREYGSAVDELRGPVESVELAPLAKPLLGNALYGAGRPIASISVNLAVIADAPQRLDSLRDLASAWFDLAANSQALDTLQRIQEFDPRDPRAPRVIGQIRLEQGDYEGALQSLKLAMGRAAEQPGNPPTHPDVLLDMATCQWKLKQYEAAEKLLQRCPASDRREYLKAACLYEQGHKDGAKQIIEELLTHTPASAAVGRFAARMAREAGSADESLQLLLSMVAQNPFDDEVHADLALTFHELGDETQATKAERTVERLHSLRQAYAERLDAFAKAPDEPEARFQAGIAARDLRLVAIARVWFESVLEISPDHAAAREALQEMSGAAPRNDKPAIPATPITRNNGTGT